MKAIARTTFKEKKVKEGSKIEEGAEVLRIVEDHHPGSFLLSSVIHRDSGLFG
jgi:hypothetical protein